MPPRPRRSTASLPAVLLLGRLRVPCPQRVRVVVLRVVVERARLLLLVHRRPRHESVAVLLADVVLGRRERELREDDLGRVHVDLEDAPTSTAGSRSRYFKGDDVDRAGSGS